LDVLGAVLDVASVPPEGFLQSPSEQKPIAEIAEADALDAVKSGRERITVRLGRTTHEVGARFLALFLRDLQPTLRLGSGSGRTQRLGSGARVIRLRVGGEREGA
jgi:hypothetical protein